MKRLRRLRWMLLSGFLSCCLIPVLAFAAPLTEQQKIDALIHSVEVLPGAQFIRNGSTYDGKAAADHLRMKRRYAGSRITTAEEFIDRCASQSSFSGRPYLIRFANGKTVDSGDYFRAELRRIEARSANAQPGATHVPVSRNG